jgi:YVTN family beta-propeller protein
VEEGFLPRAARSFPRKAAWRNPGAQTRLGTRRIVDARQTPRRHCSGGRHGTSAWRNVVMSQGMGWFGACRRPAAAGVNGRDPIDCSPRKTEGRLTSEPAVLRRPSQGRSAKEEKPMHDKTHSVHPHSLQTRGQRGGRSAGQPASAGNNIEAGRRFATARSRIAVLALAALSVAAVAPGAALAQPNCKGHLYVANSFSDNVSVIDTRRNEVVATIPVGHNPAEMTFTPDQKQIYVSNSGSDSISVIDLAGNTVASTIPTDHFPLGMAFTPDGSRLVISYEPNVVKIITVATGASTPPIKVGLDPEQIRMTPDGKYLYVDSTLGKIDVVDIDRAQVIARIPIKDPDGGFLPLPYNLLMSPDGKTLYVGAVLGGFVAVIDTRSNAVVDTWPASAPVGMDYSLDHRSLYVTDYYGANFDEYDAATGALLRSHATVRQPAFVAVREDGRYAYFGQAYGSTMTVFDTRTWAPSKTLQVGNGANALLICNSP